MTTIALSILILAVVIYPCILAAGIRAGWLLRGVAVALWAAGTWITAFESYLWRAVRHGMKSAFVSARAEWQAGWGAVTR